MAKNLCYQMTSAIENGFCPGADKHSIKKQNREPDYKIYSYAGRKEMMDFAHRFSAFLKEIFPDVRMVKDIQIEHINAYLASKTNVTGKTLQHEAACINKLELCVNKKFGLSVDWRTGRMIPKTGIEKRRTAVFSEEQIQGLKDYFASKKDCDSKNAFFLAIRFSLRASEVVRIQVRDILWDKNLLHIHESKGKRSRDITMTEDDKLFLKKLAEGKKDTERLIPLKADSICVYLNRACKKIGYDDIVQAKSSYHALRKYSITKYYKEQSGIVGEKEARQMTMKRLGHGKDRNDLYRVYIHV